MRRAAIEKPRTKNVWRKHWDKHVREQNGDRDAVQCECDSQVNRFRKGQKQGGCGRPQCYLCHGEKLLGIPKPRDKKLALIAKDEMRMLK